LDGSGNWLIWAVVNYLPAPCPLLCHSSTSLPMSL
jgi:hypothetical protein